jgi:hypothetical protein
MAKVIIPSTPDIEKAGNLLEEFIHQMLDARKSFPGLGEYEASIEALNLMYLIIRDIEAVIILSKDLVFLPSAMILTRSVFEMSMKTLWMLDPQDPFDREVRWLAQLQTEEEYYDTISQQSEKLGVENSTATRMRGVISGFRMGVTKALPKPYAPISKVPSLAKMMKEIHEEHRYSFYSFLCQYSHGTHVATNVYRMGLGTEKKFGEYVSPESWGLIFSICWYCLAKTSEKIFEVVGGDASLFLKDELIQEIQSVIQKIEPAN